MNSQRFSSETRPPSFNSNIENFPQNLDSPSQSSLIHNHEPDSKKDDLNQLKEEALLTESPRYFQSSDRQLEESKRIVNKIQRIEDQLSQGWFYDFFQGTLIFVKFVAPLWCMVLVIDIFSFWITEEYGWVKLYSILLGYLFYCIFLCFKHIKLQKDALKEKDPNLAAQAVRLVAKFTTHYSILIVIVFLVVIAYFCYFVDERKRWLDILGGLFWKFVIFYVIPVGGSNIISKKMKILLEERMDLVMKAAANNDANSSEQLTCEENNMIF